MRHALAAALILLFVTAPALAEKDCHLHRVAALAMVPSDYRVLVPASIDGKPLTMMIDTGSFVTTLTEDKAKELGLPVIREPDSQVAYFGGVAIRNFTRVTGFQLGNLKAGHLDYPLMPAGFLPEGENGILGMDFLANFDLDLDFAGGKVNLFRPHECEETVGYWTDQAPSVIDFRRSEDLKIPVTVVLDGKKLDAIVDTGSSISVLSLETAQYLFRIDDQDKRLTDAPRVNNNPGNKQFPFKEMRLGDVVVQNPKIILVPDQKAQMGPVRPDLIIGMTVLRQLHVYLSYRERKLYVTAASAH